MSTSVDTRVVEMKFDNASFQKGVAETMATLDKMSDKLDSKKTFSLLDNVKGVLENMGFESLGNGLDGLLAKAGAVFGGLTDMVGSFSKSLLSVSGVASVLLGGGALIQAITGGSRRATNIENARFQIQGLGADWVALKDDINYAVDGTAYGFDSAAMAASQLTASGIAAGDAMKTSLRAISGVAAMTNSDYESISSVFTTVAGQGKLMAMQLRQLEARGLNVAATLANQLGYTEAEIRDFVTDGVIDFQTFAQAMDDAFGEHSKEANKTFTGAVANMKAALNKIGADFFEPIHELERETALGFRLFFNAIREGLNKDITMRSIEEFGDTAKASIYGALSTISSFRQNMQWLGDDILASFQKLYDSGVIQNFVAGFARINNAFFYGAWINTSALISSIFEKLENVNLYQFNQGLRVIGENLSHFFEITASQIPVVVDILGNLAASVLNIIGAIGSFASPIIDAFFGALASILNIGSDGVSGFLQTLSNWTQGLQEFTANLSLSEEQMEGIRSVFDKVFSAIGSILAPLGKVFESIGTAIGENLPKVLPVLESLAEIIGNLLAPAIAVVSSALSAFLDMIASLVSSISGFVSQFVDLEAVGDFIKGLADSLSELSSQEALDAFIKNFENLGRILASINFDNVRQSFDSFTKSVSSNKEELKNASSGLGGILGFLGDSILGLFKVEKAYADEGEGGFLSDVTSKISDSANSILSVKNTLLNSLASIGQGVMDFISNFKMEDALTAISAVITGITTGLILKTAYNINDVIKTFAGGIKSINGVIDSIAGVFKSLSGGIETFAKASLTEARADMIKSIAISIGVLAGSLFLLAQLDVEQMKRGAIALGAIAVVFGLLVAVIGLIGKFMTKGMNEKQMLSFASSLAAFSMAIAVMAGSIAMLGLVAGVLSMVDPQRLWSGIGAILALLAGMVGLSMAVGNIKASYASLYGFAAAMLALGMAIMPLVASVLVLSMLPWQKVAIGIIELAVILWALEEATSVLANSMVRGDAANIAAFATMLFALGVAIIPLVGAVVLLGHLDFLKVVQGILALAAIMLGLSVAIKTMSKAFSPQIVTSLLAVSVTLAAFGVSLIAIAASMALISALPIEGVDNAVGAIIAVVAALTLLTAISGLMSPATMLDLSVALVAFGLSVMAIAGALTIMSLIPVDGLVKGIVALVSVLGIFIGVGTLLSTVLSGAAVALVVFSVALIGIGAGLSLIGVGLIALATGLSMLAVLGPAAATEIGVSMEIMAQHVGESMKTMAEKTAEAIVIFGKTLSANSDQIASDAATLGKSAAKGFGEAAPEFGIAGVNAIIAFAQGIGAQAGVLVGAGVLIIENLLIGIGQGAGKLVNAAAQTAIMFINGVADAIRNNAGMLADAIGNVVHTIFGLVEGLIADGLEQIFGPNPVADWIRQSADEQVAEAEAASKRVTEAFQSSNEETLKNHQNLMDMLTQTTEQGGEGMANAAGNNGADMLSALRGATDMLPEDMRGTFSDGIAAIEGLSSDAESAGDLIGDSAINAVVDGVDRSAGSVQTSMQNAVNQAKNVDTSGTDSVGTNLVAGIIRGIEAKENEVAVKAASLVQKAVAAMNIAGLIKSPSRKTMETGQYLAMGLAIGLMNYSYMVSKASYDLVDAAVAPLSSVSSKMSYMMDSIDWDANPTITPVLDTSLLEEGMAGVDSLMSRSYAYPMSTRAFDAVGYSQTSNRVTNLNVELNYNAGTDAAVMVNGIVDSLQTALNLEG